jgi:hypothetical protein
MSQDSQIAQDPSSDILHSFQHDAPTDIAATAPKEKTPKKRSRVVVWAMGTAVCVSLGVGMGELVVRLFPALMPVHKQLMEFAVHSPYRGVVLDDDVGFLRSPNLRQVVQTRDYTDVDETDGKGFSNVEPWPERPAMVFLGDSMVVGTGVGVWGSFPRLIAGMMDTTAVNLALAGAGPERQFAVYRKFGMGLRPRHVITCVYLPSDFTNDRHFASWIREGKPTNYDEFRLRPAPPKSASFISSLQQSAEKSWLFMLGRDLIMRWLPGYIPDRYRFDDGYQILLNRETIAFAMENAAPEDPRIEELLVSLDKMRKLVVQGASTMSVVLMPSSAELFGLPAGVTAGNLVLRTRQRLQEAGFSVLDLYPALRRAGQTRSPYFRTDGHFNEYGHRVVAETFVSWFRRGLPETVQLTSPGTRR